MLGTAIAFAWNALATLSTWIEVRVADFYAPELHASGGPHAKATMERLARARTAQCAAGKQTLGVLECEVCAFNFSARYGSRGVIECHHNKPVSELKPGQKTRLEDLALICANCHRIIHRKRPWLSIDDVKGLPNRNALTQPNLVENRGWLLELISANSPAPAIKGPVTVVGVSCDPDHETQTEYG
jgi:hypothetical protein